MNLRTIIIYIFLFISNIPLLAQSQIKEQTVKDKEMLGKAIEYFGGGKFHEAGLIFTKLQQRYELNPRFKAYLAVCYFKDQEYEKTIEILDKTLPELEAFSPHERAIYYYTSAESHFQLAQYDTAKVYFEKTLPVCFDDEKGDIYFRIGFCNLFLGNEDTTKDDFANASKMFKAYNATDKDKQARIIQTEIMLKRLLVPHRTGGMDMTDKETRNDENKNTDNKNNNVKSKNRKKVYLHRRG